MVNLVVNQLIMKVPIHLLDKEQLPTYWHIQVHMAITVPCAWDGHATGLPWHLLAQQFETKPASS